MADTRESAFLRVLHAVVFAPVATVVLLIPAVAMDQFAAYLAIQKFTCILSVSCCATSGALSLNRYAGRGFAMKVAHVFCICTTLHLVFNASERGTSWSTLIAVSGGIAMGQLTDPGNASRPIGKAHRSLCTHALEEALTRSYRQT